jgi:hypothetical protein
MPRVFEKHRRTGERSALQHLQTSTSVLHCKDSFSSSTASSSCFCSHQLALAPGGMLCKPQKYDRNRNNPSKNILYCFFFFNINIYIIYYIVFNYYYNCFKIIYKIYLVAKCIVVLKKCF